MDTEYDITLRVRVTAANPDSALQALGQMLSNTGYSGLSPHAQLVARMTPQSNPRVMVVRVEAMEPRGETS